VRLVRETFFFLSVSVSFNHRIWTFGTEITASSNQSQAVVLGLPIKCNLMV